MTSMDLEIIIFAVIAVALFARLWVVLGRRSDDDRQRPHPFLAPFIRPKDNAPVAPDSNNQNRPAQPLLQVFKAAPASLAGGLEQIKSRDPKFDEKQFLRDARINFALIVEDFAKGDMTRIASLLTPQVLAHFQTALEARRAAGQAVESKITQIKDVETAAARMDGDKAFMTVRFISNQENVLRDGAGQVIGGEVGKVEEITDLWTFARDMTSTDAKWLLAETGT